MYTTSARACRLTPQSISAAVRSKRSVSKERADQETRSGALPGKGGRKSIHKKHRKAREPPNGLTWTRSQRGMHTSLGAHCSSEESASQPTAQDTSERHKHARQCQDVCTDAFCSDDRLQELGGGCHVIRDVADPTQADEHASQHQETQGVEPERRRDAVRDGNRPIR